MKKTIKFNFKDRITDEIENIKTQIKHSLKKIKHSLNCQIIQLIIKDNPINY